MAKGQNHCDSIRHIKQDNRMPIWRPRLLLHLQVKAQSLNHLIFERLLAALAKCPLFVKGFLVLSSFWLAAGLGKSRNPNFGSLEWYPDYWNFGLDSKLSYQGLTREAIDSILQKPLSLKCVTLMGTLAALQTLLILGEVSLLHFGSRSCKY